MFVHHVIFWLKEDLTPAEKELFYQKTMALAGIETLTLFKVGKPAATDRPVIDRSYTYSLLTAFEDQAGQDVYQTHPLHLDFLANCKHMWSKVLIYDAE